MAPEGFFIQVDVDTEVWTHPEDHQPRTTTVFYVTIEARDGSVRYVHNARFYVEREANRLADRINAANLSVEHLEASSHWYAHDAKRLEEEWAPFGPAWQREREEEGYA